MKLSNLAGGTTRIARKSGRKAAKTVRHYRGWRGPESNRMVTVEKLVRLAFQNTGDANLHEALKHIVAVRRDKSSFLSKSNRNWCVSRFGSANNFVNQFRSLAEGTGDLRRWKLTRVRRHKAEG